MDCLSEIIILFIFLKSIINNNLKKILQNKSPYIYTRSKWNLERVYIEHQKKHIILFLFYIHYKKIDILKCMEIPLVFTILQRHACASNEQLLVICSLFGNDHRELWRH